MRLFRAKVIQPIGIIHSTKPAKPKSFTSSPKHKVSVTTSMSHGATNPHSLYNAQLSNARTAVASSKPYRPKKSKRI